MNATMPAMRERRLRALAVEPLRLRLRAPPVAPIVAQAVSGAASAVVPDIASGVPRVRRLALQPDQAELGDPVINKMYVALTEAVAKAGLQSVRVCDVADDPTAAVMVFGAAPSPEGVPAERVLHVDPLSVLYADRERKRLLWEQMRALGRDGGWA